jgi:hypothetical protein
MKLKLAAAAVAMGAMIATSFFWSQMMKDDPKGVARNLAKAVLRKDPRGVYRFRAPHEEDGTGLTEQKFVQIWQDLIAPILDRIQFTAGVKSERLNDPPTQGVAEVQALFPDGRSDTWGFAAWVTDEGPRTAILHDVLTMAAVLEHSMAHPETGDQPKNFGRIKLERLRKHRSYLEKLGVVGMVSAGGPRYSWDEWEQRWQREADSFVQSLASAQAGGLAP